MMEYIALGIVATLAYVLLGMGVLRYEERVGSDVRNFRPVIVALWPVFLIFQSFA